MARACQRRTTCECEGILEAIRFPKLPAASLTQIEDSLPLQADEKRGTHAKNFSGFAGVGLCRDYIICAAARLWTSKRLGKHGFRRSSQRPRKSSNCWRKRSAKERRGRH